MSTFNSGPVLETSFVSKGRDDEGNKIINQYVLVSTLGRGAFSKVKLVAHSASEEMRALKLLDMKRLSKTRRLAAGETTDGFEYRTALDDVRREIAVMKRLRHPSVCTLHEVMEDSKDGTLYLVLDYMQKGPVAILTPEGIVESPPRGIDSIRRIFNDILCGLSFLHANGIVHRDIKPDNLLMDAGDTCRLCDFGVSAFVGVQAGSDLVHATDGTPAFLPPEFYAAASSSGTARISGRAADIWAVGVVMYCLAHGELPFKAVNMIELGREITETEPPYGPAAGILPGAEDAEVDDLVAVIRSMMQKNVSDRANLVQLSTSAFATGRGRYPPVEICHEGQFPGPESVTKLEMNNSFKRGYNIRLSDRVALLTVLKGRVSKWRGRAISRMTERAGSPVPITAKTVVPNPIAPAVDWDPDSLTEISRLGRHTVLVLDIGNDSLMACRRCPAYDSSGSLGVMVTKALVRHKMLDITHKHNDNIGLPPCVPVEIVDPATPLADMINTVGILHSLDCAYLSKIWYVVIFPCQANGRVLVLSDYAERGCVLDALQGDPIEIPTIHNWITGLCQALHLLHAVNIYHGHVSLQKVMINGSGDAVLEHPVLSCFKHKDHGGMDDYDIECLGRVLRWLIAYGRQPDIPVDITDDVWDTLRPRLNEIEELQPLLSLAEQITSCGKGNRPLSSVFLHPVFAGRTLHTYESRALKLPIDDVVNIVKLSSECSSQEQNITFKAFDRALLMARLRGRAMQWASRARLRIATKGRPCEDGAPAEGTAAPEADFASRHHVTPESPVLLRTPEFPDACSSKRTSSETGSSCSLENVKRDSPRVFGQMPPDLSCHSLVEADALSTNSSPRYTPAQLESLDPAAAAREVSRRFSKSQSRLSFSMERHRSPASSSTPADSGFPLPDDNIRHVFGTPTEDGPPCRVKGFVADIILRSIDPNSVPQSWWHTPSQSPTSRSPSPPMRPR